ncbi:MAG: TatD family hydrolase [Muribaculaceae bacterium]|nr:TatD family hydrolase [Muribaculaceae bacterium]
MYIDSHTHLYLDEFKDDRKEVMKRAIDGGIGHFMFPNVDLNTIAPMKELAAQYPDRIDMAIGLHPTEVNADFKTAINVIEQEAQKGIYKAIGEIGIDLYWDKTFVNEQIEAFRQQCELANLLNVPVIIHCREGLKQILDVFDSMKQVPDGVFHSFGGTADDIMEIRKRGDFYFGINGIVTFKNARIKDILPVITADRLLLETDSPYLAPMPKRGKRNESSFMIHTAGYVANVLGITNEQLADITSMNYHTLFG